MKSHRDGFHGPAPAGRRARLAAEAGRALGRLDMASSHAGPRARQLQAAPWCVATLRIHRGRVTSVAFHPSGQTLATASGDSTVKTTDVPTMQVETTLSGHTEGVWCVSYSAQGNIASGSGDKFKVWDVSESLRQRFLGTICDSAGKHARTVHAHDGPVTALAYDRAGERIASASQDETAQVWDVRSEACVATLQGHEDSVTCVAFGGAGLMATGSFDTTIKCWDTRPGECAYACAATLTGHDLPVVCIAFDAAGTRVASGSFDKTVKLWAPEPEPAGTSAGMGAGAGRWQCTATLDAGQLVRGVTFDATAQHVACGGDDASVLVWSVRTFQCVAVLGHSTGVLAVQFQPGAHGSLLAAGCEDGTVKLWDTACLYTPFWRMCQHRLHSRPLAACVGAALLVACRHRARGSGDVFWLPGEIWLCILGCLRNTDFGPPAAAAP